jgi:hypothetical protein
MHRDWPNDVDLFCSKERCWRLIVRTSWSTTSEWRILLKTPRVIFKNPGALDHFCPIIPSENLCHISSHPFSF